MKISPAAEFAVRGALVLAEHYGDGPTTLDAICEARGLSKQYLVKIFASLARAGLVTPVRGKRGGYLLAREPGEINLLELIEAVEGPIAVNFCQHIPPRCEQSECALRTMWSDIQQFICSKLGSTTLGQCLEVGQTDPIRRAT
ncbi:MAG: Rrf2 family transcriptional regulator [Phycisphaerae bacterium]|jgi:Rrf2 family protein|nr:Rrf2 family transcriptional regulator [Phycisphaerae bacterium]